MDVGLGHAAHRRLEDLDLHLGMLELAQLLADRLDRAADVGAEDDVQRLHLVLLAEPLEEVFQGDVFAGAAAEFLLAAVRGAAFGQLAGLGDVLQGVEAVAGGGGDAQPRHVHRRRRPGLRVLHAAVERVVHRLDAAVAGAADHHVAHAQRPRLHEELGDHAAVFVHLRFEARAAGGAVGDLPCTRATPPPSAASPATRRCPSPWSRWS